MEVFLIERVLVFIWTGQFFIVHVDPHIGKCLESLALTAKC